MSLTAAIIPAAGKSERMKGEAKQFRLLGGRPLLGWALAALAKAEQVSEIVIGAAAERVAEVEALAAACNVGKPVKVVGGGPERQETVRLCLAAIASGTEAVVIHDAARPFVKVETIERTIRAGVRAGAATAAIRPADAVKFEHLTRGVLENLDRNRLLMVQTPQAFRADLIIAAHDAAARHGIIALDDTALTERQRVSTEIVPGSALAFKITTDDDWAMAEALVKAGVVECY
jgi:2-C-methyl-D-erythritol 4-phosphate cytidylyltransferase